MTLQSHLNESPTGVATAVCDARSLAVCELLEENKTEVLKYLSQRSLPAVVMSGYIRDNGMQNILNRGAFYGCRDRLGQLQGVALIGHAMFIEAHQDEAVERFARLAQEVGVSHMIMGEQNLIEGFWSSYALDGQLARRLCRERHFELTKPPEGDSPLAELRLATLDELPLIVPVHAAMAFEESGVDPQQTDPSGFRARCRRRIERGRVCVWVEHGQLIFKADVIVDTPDVIYLEGIYVDPRHRGRGYGSTCMAELSRRLMQCTKSVTLVVNEDNSAAQRFFPKIGFVARESYDTIYLRPRTS